MTCHRCFEAAPCRRCVEAMPLALEPRWPLAALILFVLIFTGAML